MTEYEVHKLIEQQNPEAKQRIWKKIKKAIFDTQNDCIHDKDGVCERLSDKETKQPCIESPCPHYTKK